MGSALNSPVLVLNRFWQVVNTCPARRALTLLFSGHAKAVSVSEGFESYDFLSWVNFSESFKGEHVRSARYSLAIPSVIILTFFSKLPRKDVKFTRHNVFVRDGYRCQYCGVVLERGKLNLDHVLPRDRGGGLSWENTVCSCVPCNSKKANRLPHEAGMRLLRSPSRPKPLMGGLGRHGVLAGGVFPEAWRHFVDVSRWVVELGDETSGEGRRREGICERSPVIKK